MGAPSMAAIDRKSSIETEPRTLNMQQIEFAREAALYVVNTKSMEEAIQVFTEGMEPVVNVGKQGLYATSVTEEADEENDEYPSKRSNEQSRVDQFRDVLTAPF